MRFRRILTAVMTTAMGLTGLLAVNPQTVFAAQYTCTWTGGGSDHKFSTAGNWSGCNGAAPQSGDTDNLVFPLAASGFQPQNDLVSPTFASVTFTGTGTGYDIINTTGMTVGNMTDSSTASQGYNLIEGTVNRGMVTTSIAGNPNSDLVIHNLSGVSNDLSLSYFKTAELDNPTAVTVGPDVTIDAAGAGDITVTGDLTLSTSSSAGITVANGGTLRGSGVISGGGTYLTVQSGGTVAPGNSPGCVTAPTFNLNGTYQAQIGGPSACSQYDQVVATNSVVITNGTLQPSLINGFIPTVGQTFTVINNTSANPITGVFTNLPEGSTISADGYDFKLSYVGGDGNDVTLTVIGASAASGSGGAGAGASKTPGTPNTGLALLAGNPALTAFLSSAIAGMLILIARRLRPLES